MDNPFVRGNVTRLKLLLPVKKARAWKLIGTPRGLMSWFPTTVKGRIAVGKTVEFGWTGAPSEKFKVLDVKKDESWQMDWWKTGKVRYSVKGGTPAIFTLEVRYQKGPKGKQMQIPELVGWSSFLMNLKSVAMKGPDLRSKNPKYSWKRGFID